MNFTESYRQTNHTVITVIMGKVRLWFQQIFYKDYVYTKPPSKRNKISSVMSISYIHLSYIRSTVVNIWKVNILFVNCKTR